MEIIKHKKNYLFIVLIILSSCSMLAQGFNDSNDEYSKVPDPSAGSTLPIGINIAPLSYYTKNYIFNDVMTTASSMKTFSSTEWNTDLIDEIVVDENGYPTYIPQTTSDGNSTKVRFLINNYYSGRYIIIYDGNGSLAGSGAVKYNSEDNYYYVDLTGTGSNIYIDITYSDPSDPIKNMHIIAEDFGIYDNNALTEAIAEGSYWTFHEKFLEGLESMHALRFMDILATNNSKQVNWGDRVSISEYSQSLGEGIAQDYAIELSNELQTDAWICVPHMASDDYIRKMAELWRDNLDENLTIYVEYSNELWNWMFTQAHWVDECGVYEDYPTPVDSYVQTDLQNLEVSEGYPEQDAYMMARTFRIWNDVFGSERDRIVNVATGQQAWSGNSERIMEYLFDVDGIGCDALSVTGYFGFSSDSHTEWLDYGNDLPLEKIYSDTYEYFIDTTVSRTRSSAAVANKYGVDYLVYEGGQHMQPYRQSEWNYNQRLYDFQITDYMYNLYMYNFNLHTEADVNCKLFVAYNSVSERETKYGSWGHLESMDQIGTSYSDAPKFKALLDVNTP